MPIPTRVAQWLLLALLFYCLPSSLQAQNSVVPTWSWAQQVNGTSTAWPYDMVVDGRGNTYVTGSFYGTMTLNPTTQLATSNANDSDGFLVKFTPTGSVAWARKLGSASSYDNADGVALDANGNVYVTGAFRGQLNAGSIVLNSTYQAAYLIKYDSAGVAQWGRQSAGPNVGDSASGHDVELDAAGNIYLSGAFGWGMVSFGGITLSAAAGSSYAHFVVKYDTGGTVQWARADGSTTATQSYLSYLAVGPAGEVYMTCSMREATTFGSTSYPSRGGIDAFVVKYDTQGNRQWVRQLGGPGDDEIRLGAVDAYGDLYVPLSFSNQALVGGTVLASAGLYDQALVKLDSQGSPLWTRTVGGTEFDLAQQAVLDAFGNVYLLGWFMSQVTPAPGVTFSSASHYDALLLSYTSQGTLRWGQASGGFNPDDFMRMGFDPMGKARVVGRFSNTLPLGAITLTGPATTSNWFVASLTDNLYTIATITTMAPSTGSAGQVVTLTGTGFVGVTQVLFNGQPAASFTVRSASRLEAVVPAGVTTGPISVRTAAGTTASATLFQPTALATTTAARRAALTLYPNPATTTVYLAAAAGTSVQILDAVGRLRRTTTVASDGAISVRGLAPGLYLVHATDAQDQHYINRVVVQ